MRLFSFFCVTALALPLWASAKPHKKATCPSPDELVSAALDIFTHYAEHRDECPALREAFEKVYKDIQQSCPNRLDVSCIFEQISKEEEVIFQGFQVCEQQYCKMSKVKDVIGRLSGCDNTVEDYVQILVTDACKDILSSKDCETARRQAGKVCTSAFFQPFCSEKVSHLMKESKISCNFPFKGLRAVQNGTTETEVTLGASPDHCANVKEIAFAVAELITSGDLKSCESVVISVVEMVETCSTKGLHCFISQFEENRKIWEEDLEKCHNSFCSNSFMRAVYTDLRTCEKTVRDFARDAIREVCHSESSCTIFSNALDQGCGLEGVQLACDAKVGDIVSLIPTGCSNFKLWSSLLVQAQSLE